MFEGRATDRNESLAWQITRFVLGGVLLTSATLKLHRVLVPPGSEGNGPFGARGLQLSAIAIETVLTLWLWSGWRPRAARCAAIALFALFAAVGLRQAASGVLSCDCFGNVVVSPWISFAFAVATVAWLALIEPSRGPATQRRRIALGGAVLAVALVFASLVGLTAGRSLALGDEVPEPGSVVRVDAEKWVGQPFPLLSFVKSNRDLRNGRWLVFFHRKGCKACEDAIPALLTTAYEQQDDQQATRLALVDVPGGDKSYDVALPAVGLCARGRLDASFRWQMPVPLYCTVNDGVLSHVTGAWSDLPTSVTPNQSTTADRWRLTAGAPHTASSRRRARRQEFACGPLALMAVMRTLDRTPDATDAERLLDAAGDHGTDLLQLKSLAEERGLHAVGVSADVAALRRIGRPAIVHLDGVAFAAVLAYQPDGVVVFAAGHRTTVVPDDQIARSFGSPGRALLLSPETIAGLPSEADAAARHPLLRAERSCLPLGRLFSFNWDGQFRIFNDSDDAVRIAEVTAIRDRNVECCNSSVEAALDAVGIPAKGSAIVTVRGRHSIPGSFTHAVAIVPADAKLPPLTVPVRGVVSPGVVVDRLIHEFPGTELRATSSLDIPLEILAPNAALRDVEVRLPEGVPLRGAVVEAGGQAALRLTWTGHERPGLHRHQVSLRDRPADDRPAISFTVVIPVRPRLDVFPMRIVVSSDELKGRWVRRFRVESSERLSGLTAVWSAGGLGQVLDTRLEPAGERALSVIVMPKSGIIDTKTLPEDLGALVLTLGEGTPAHVPVILGERDSLAAGGPSRPPVKDKKSAHDPQAAHAP
jgi:hypothetical protein